MENKIMNYNLYNNWRKAVAKDDTNYQESDARVKCYLTQLSHDDVARKMVGLKMLEDGIIDKDMMNILMLKQIGNYL